MARAIGAAWIVVLLLAVLPAAGVWWLMRQAARWIGAAWVRAFVRSSAVGQNSFRA